MKQLIQCVFFSLLMFFGVAVAADAEQLERAVDGSHRDPENVARDVYRHPKETLSFFNVRPTMRVLEILPGGGWYTEILAPFLRDAGALNRC